MSVTELAKGAAESVKSVAKAAVAPAAATKVLWMVWLLVSDPKVKEPKVFVPASSKDEAWAAFCTKNNVPADMPGGRVIRPATEKETNENR